MDTCFLYRNLSTGDTGVPYEFPRDLELENFENRITFPVSLVLEPGPVRELIGQRVIDPGQLTDIRERIPTLIREKRPAFCLERYTFFSLSFFFPRWLIASWETRRPLVISVSTPDFAQSSPNCTSARRGDIGRRVFGENLSIPSR